MALVSYENSDIESSDSDEATDKPLVDTNTHHLEADKVEPEYRMRVPKSAKLPSLLPNLRSTKLKTGKVLFSVPSLEALDSSSGSEDEHGASSKLNQRSNKIGKRSSSRPTGDLLALLPPTRFSCNREGPKPAILIPHQLSTKRKPGPSPSANREDVAVSRNSQQEDLWETEKHLSDDNDDDHVGNTEDAEKTAFFSFYEPSDGDSQAVAVVRSAAATTALQTMISSSDHSMIEKSEPEEPGIERDIGSTFPRPGAASVTTTQHPSLCAIDPDVLSQFDIPTEGNRRSKEDDSEDAHCWTEQNFVPGPERKRARLTQPGACSLPVSDLLRSSNQPIREVNQADLTAGAHIELMKSVTADESQYVSQRTSVEDDPGKLAHRKHQITWLAHQAQVNEVELEKRWAEARRNKATGRAKYGF